MDIEHYQGTHQDPLKNVEVLSDDGDHSGYELLHEVLVSCNASLFVPCLVQHCLSHSLRPLYQIHQQYALGIETEEPVLPAEWVLIWVLFQCLLSRIVEGLYHHLLDLHQPVLDWALCEDTSWEPNYLRHGLRLGGGHWNYLPRFLNIGELNLVYVIKALPQVGLDCVGVPGLGEDLKELVVGEEVEPWESCPFDLEIVLHLLLNLL